MTNFPAVFENQIAGSNSPLTALYKPCFTEVEDSVVTAPPYSKIALLSTNSAQVFDAKIPPQSFPNLFLAILAPSGTVNFTGLAVLPNTYKLPFTITSGFAVVSITTVTPSSMVKLFPAGIMMSVFT